MPKQRTEQQGDCPYCANPAETSLPLTREVLDGMHCEDPECDCTTMEFTPSCHPLAGQRVFYCRTHGTVSVFCAECRFLQGVFLIAAADNKQHHAGHAHRRQKQYV